MSSSQAVLRTEATSIIGARYLNTPESIWLPTPPALSKGFIRQETPITAQANNFTPGATATFQVPRDTDLSADWELRGTMGGIPAGLWNGGATFTRYIDNIAYGVWAEARCFSGTQQLQVITPFEQMVYIFFWLAQEKRRNALQDIGNGTPAQRTARDVANFEVIGALYTLLGFRLHGKIFVFIFT